MLARHEELSSTIATTIATKFTQIDQVIHTNSATTDKNSKDIEAVHITIANQGDQIKLQGDQIKDLMSKLELGDTISRKEAYEAMSLANAIESHNRRWAVRILGFPAPTTQETSTESKYLTMDFLKEVFKINNITFEDIDCAHRVGKVSDQKQTMLVRFFSRDLVSAIISKKSTLKGTGFVVFEDSTLINHKLLNALKLHPNIDSAWITNGTVWAKKLAGGAKQRMTIWTSCNLHKYIYNTCTTTAVP
jgi:hypothetical protein